MPDLHRVLIPHHTTLLEITPNGKTLVCLTEMAGNISNGRHFTTFCEAICNWVILARCPSKHATLNKWAEWAQNQFCQSSFLNVFWVHMRIQPNHCDHTTITVAMAEIKEAALAFEIFGGQRVSSER